MQNLPKLKELNPPLRYFDSLPEEIIAKKLNPKRKRTAWISYAAAAMLILGIGLWWTSPLQYSPTDELQALDQEVLLLIESSQWTAEDVLSLSEDPNLILDEIIEEEMTTLSPIWSDENNWF